MNQISALRLLAQRKKMFFTRKQDQHHRCLECYKPINPITHYTHLCTLCRLTIEQGWLSPLTHSQHKQT